MNKTTKTVPRTIRQFVRAVTSSKVSFNYFQNDVWEVVFWGSLNVEQCLNAIPENYDCKTMGYFDGLVSVGLMPKRVV